MKINKTVAIILGGISLAFGVLTNTAYAKDLNTYSFKSISNQSSNVDLSKESEDFLKNSGIDIKEFNKHLLKFKYQNDKNLGTRNVFISGTNETQYVGNLESDIQALKNAAKANGFTNIQIQNYVLGLLKNETQTIEYNSIDLKSAPDRTEDNSYGTGFEALSFQNFTQITTKVKLPSTNIKSLKEIHYLFISPSSPRDIFDFGLIKGEYNWEGCYLLDKNNHPNIEENMVRFPLNSRVYDGDMLYYNIYRDSDGYMVCKILNNNDFSDVKASKRIWLNNSSVDRISFNKQITMTFSKDGVFGSSIKDARFVDSYLYNSKGYYIFETKVNNNRHGIFGDTRIPGSRYFTKYQHSGNTDYVDINLR